MYKAKLEFEETIKDRIDFSEFLIESKDLKNLEIMKLLHRSGWNVYQGELRGAKVFIKEFNLKEGNEINVDEFTNLVKELDVCQTCKNFAEFKGIFIDMFPLVYTVWEFFSSVTLGDLYYSNKL